MPYVAKFVSGSRDRLEILIIDEVYNEDDRTTTETAVNLTAVSDLTLHWSLNGAAEETDDLVVEGVTAGLCYYQWAVADLSEGGTIDYFVSYTDATGLPRKTERACAIVTDVSL